MAIHAQDEVTRPSLSDEQRQAHADKVRGLIHEEA